MNERIKQLLDLVRFLMISCGMTYQQAMQETIKQI